MGLAIRREAPVLLVEDSQGWAQLMRLVLEAALGQRVELATTGREALARLAAQPPAVLLLDLDLGDIPGREIAEKANASYGATLPVLVISSSTHVGSRLQRLPVRGILRKPFDWDDLVATTARLLAVEADETAES
jgi:DNA-binding response OmpR family regulator